MWKRKSHDEFIIELSAINPDIEAVEKYESANKPMRFRCKICGHEWRVPPSNVLRGTGCKACMIRARTKPVNVFMQEMRVTNPTVEIIGNYVNTNTPIKCRCKECGYVWSTRPSVLLRGSGCPKCAGNAKRTHEEFVAKMEEVSPGIEILGKYINTDTKIKCQCRLCGQLFQKRPFDLLRGGKCPNERRHKTPK